MIELVGWLAYAVVIMAFSTNAFKYQKTALGLWILGDILWIVYNVAIMNYPHMAMNFTIIIINVLGLRNYLNEKELNEDK